MKTYIIYDNTESETFHALSWYLSRLINVTGTSIVELQYIIRNMPITGIATNGVPVQVKWHKKKLTVTVEKVDSAVLQFDPEYITFLRRLTLQGLENDSDLQHLIEDAKSDYSEYVTLKTKGIRIHYNRLMMDGDIVRWVSSDELPKRNLDTVILDKDLQLTLLNDIKTFVASKKEYESRGIPYKRTYCLYGPPGTGKTSTITALASEINMDLAILNISKLGDDAFVQLVSEIPENAILLIEDIDSLFGNDRKANGLLTFTTILNVLDGNLRKDSMITFMTTNHIEQLDKALKRPGRVDVLLKVDTLSRYQVAKMWLSYFPKSSKKLTEIIQDLVKPGTSPAWFNAFLFQHRTNKSPESVYELLAIEFNKGKSKNTSQKK